MIKSFTDSLKNASHSGMYLSEFKANDEPGAQNARSVSVVVRVAHIALDDAWKAVAADHQSTLMIATPEKLRNKRLDPGEVEIMRNMLAHQDALRGQQATLVAALGLPAVGSFEEPGGVDHAIVYCLGAKFHHDVHGWTDSLFVNWYLSGPPVDFVLRGPKGEARATINPGDAIVFDPSHPHGVLPVGAQTFDAGVYAVYPEGSEEASDEDFGTRVADQHSIFAAYVVPMIEDIDKIMGVRRASPDEFLRVQGLCDLCSPDVLVSDVDGRLLSRADRDNKMKASALDQWEDAAGSATARSLEESEEQELELSLG